MHLCSGRSAVQMNYRLVRVDDQGTHGEVLLVTVANDETALAWGRMFSLGTAVEIWCGSRQLSSLASSAGYPSSTDVEPVMIS